jgi:diguanylate cyclase (GGDEF)-like protein
VARKDTDRQVPISVEDLLRENRDLRHKISRLESARTHAYCDELTGLRNRHYFSERLSEEISRARRRSQRHFSIMMVDVNDLKAINGAHGKPEGDLVLRWVAEFLERALRAHDVICRVGEDEFAVLFPDIATREATSLLVRLRATLAKAHPGPQYSIGLSFGLATYPEDGTTSDELMKLASKEMKLDKRRQNPAAATHTDSRRTVTRS